MRESVEHTNESEMVDVNRAIALAVITILCGGLVLWVLFQMVWG